MLFSSPEMAILSKIFFLKIYQILSCCHLTDFFITFIRLQGLLEWPSFGDKRKSALFKSTIFKYCSYIWFKNLVIQGLLTYQSRNWYYLKNWVIQKHVIQFYVIQNPCIKKIFGKNLSNYGCQIFQFNFLEKIHNFFGIF